MEEVLKAVVTTTDGEKIELPLSGTNAKKEDFAVISKERIRGVEIPEGVKVIGREAFFDYPHLRDVKLPDSIEIIGSYAFAKCYQIISIDIPPAVRNMDSSVFDTDLNLHTINLRGDIPGRITVGGTVEEKFSEVPAHRWGAVHATVHRLDMEEYLKQMNVLAHDNSTEIQNAVEPAATSKTLDDCKDYYQNVYRKCLKEGVFDQDNVESSTASQLRAQFRTIRETLSCVFGSDNFDRVEQSWVEAASEAVKLEQNTKDLPKQETALSLHELKSNFKERYMACMEDRVLGINESEIYNKARFETFCETLSLVYGRDNFEKVEQEWARDIIKESYAASNVKILGSTSHSAPSITPKQDPKIGVHPDKQETAVHHCR